MANDILNFAWSSFFLGLFISALLTLASGGTTLLNKTEGQATYDKISGQFSTKAETAKISGFLENLISSTENPLIFDIVLGMLNVGLMIFKLLNFVIITVVNYFLLSVWLTQAGTPAAIIALLVFGWQFWTFYYLAKFVFGSTRLNTDK